MSKKGKKGGKKDTEATYVKIAMKLNASDWQSMFNSMDIRSKKALFKQFDIKKEILKKRKKLSNKEKSSVKSKSKTKSKPISQSTTKEQKEDIDIAERSINYRFGCRKINCIAPSVGYPDKKQAKRPVEGELKLFRAHGYSGCFQQCRQNIYLSHCGKYLIYYIASVCIVYDYEANTQRFFTMHNDDITTICVSPKKTWCASGQRDPKDEPGQGKDLPKIYIWNYKTMKSIQLLDNICWGKIAQVNWSVVSNYLYCICGDPEQTLKAWDPKLFDGKEQHTLIQCNTAKEEILGFEINPIPSEKNVDEILFFGKRKFMYGRLSKNKNGLKMKLKSISIIKCRKEGEKAFYCAQFLEDGSYLVGAASGHIYIGRGIQVSTKVSAHDKSISAMCLVSKNMLLTAGMDKKFKTFLIKEKLVQNWERVIEITDSDFVLSPTAIAYNASKQTIFCGTKENRIVKVELRHLSDVNFQLSQHNIKPRLNIILVFGYVRCNQTNLSLSNNISEDVMHIILLFYDDKDIRLIVDGHEGQVWGLTCSPDSSLFATGGFDGKVKIWDAHTMKCIISYRYSSEDSHRRRQDQICCAAWSNSGNILAFGTETSSIAVFTFQKNVLKLHCEVNIPPKSVNAEIENVSYLRFNEDSTLLAAGHMDANLYIFSVHVDVNRYEVRLEQWKPMPHIGAPTHLQFTDDSKMIKTLTRDYEICHWVLNHENKKGKFMAKIPDPDNVNWAGDPLIAGWDTQGLYQYDWDGTDLNDATMTSDKKLIVSGDDYGKVRLHNYPAIEPSACLAYAAHSEFVVGVQLLYDDSQLITCGGCDMAIFQWKLIKKT